MLRCQRLGGAIAWALFALGAGVGLHPVQIFGMVSAVCFWRARAAGAAAIFGAQEDGVECEFRCAGVAHNQ